MDEERRDEEAAQHEEGVDTEVAAGHPVDARVVQQHATDGEGAEPVERGLILELGRRIGSAPGDGRRFRFGNARPPGAPTTVTAFLREYRESDMKDI